MEPGCNGRAGNDAKIARVKVIFISARLGDKFGKKLGMDMSAMKWLIRWAGEVPTRYTYGRGGETAWQMRINEQCKAATVSFAEKVAYLQLSTAEVHKRKAEPKMFEGTWFGIQCQNGGKPHRDHQGHSEVSEC